MYNYGKLNSSQLYGLWSAITDLSEIEVNLTGKCTTRPKIIAISLIQSLTNFGLSETKKLVECQSFELFEKLYADSYEKAPVPAPPPKKINKFAPFRTYD